MLMVTDRLISCPYWRSDGKRNINEKEDPVQETIDLPAFHTGPGNHGNALLRIITGYPGTKSAFPYMVPDACSKHPLYRFFLRESALFRGIHQHGISGFPGTLFLVPVLPLRVFSSFRRR